MIHRRDFLKHAGILAAALSGAGCTGGALLASREAPPAVGPLRPGESPVLDLPEGFVSHVVSESGGRMSDGHHVPINPSGMGAFQRSDGLTVLLRNHDVPTGMASRTGPFGFQNHLFPGSAARRVYDAGADGTKPAYGAVTVTVYHTRERWSPWSGLRLGGLLGATHGCPTPWQSWICCEDIVHPADDRYARPHGYAFEVPIEGAVDVEPLRALGRFRHGGIAVDPETGLVYLAEAEPDGLLYRLIPAVPGRLHEGGRFQALALGDGADGRRWQAPEVDVEPPRPVRWVDLDGLDREAEDLRERGRERGATPFADGAALRLERGALWITCRTGGPEGRGQLWRYEPSPSEGEPAESGAPGHLALVLTPGPGSRLAGLDDLVFAPWGDAVMPGTGDDGHPYLLGRTPQGDLYEIARSRRADTRFAGATFSPDGTTLFVNLVEAGKTLAISGPWPPSLEPTRPTQQNLL